MFAENTFAQRTRKTNRKPVRTNIPQNPQPKIETENWQEFDSKDLKLKLSFPKTPKIDTRKQFEMQTVEVTSTTVQTDINGNFYLLEVREYPKKLIPKRNDLGESYGEWLKQYILSGSRILEEKNVEFGNAKGVEFTYQDTSTAVILHRVFVVENRLFQLMVHLKVARGETYKQAIEKNTEKINKYFDSLQLYDELVIDGSVA